MKYGIETLGVGIAALLALLGAAFAADEAFRIHAWLLFFLLAAGTVVLMRQIQFAPASRSAAPAPQSEYMDGVIRYGAIATVFWGIAGFLVGASSPPSSPGRN